MARTVKIWSPLSLMLLLSLLLCSFLGRAHQGRDNQHAVQLSFASFHQLAKAQPAHISYLSSAASERHPETIRGNFERKKKTRFLVRHLQQHQAVRKSSNKPYNFSLTPAADPDHEPAPDDTWHTRPRYYVFLFRLSPF